MTDRIVIADVGSTTTKAVLFRREGEWRLFRREAPTTVEAPHADVTVGLLAALRELEEASREKLFAEGVPAPLLITSSAGGGLAMVVTGLIRRVTSQSAERAALGAGAIVLDTIAIDDGRVPYQKIEALKALRPDILLLAGGFDGEALSGPVFLAELVRQAALRPKLSSATRLPVVFAGNENARGLVEETLGDGYLFHAVPNLRPESNRENLEPARAAIHELFMDHVMSHAPGYPALKDWVSAPIMPTPSAVARILEAVSAEGSRRILAVDIGGATTDVFTAEGGRVFRTVSANLGMSYSILNAAAVGGIEAVRELLDLDVSDSWLWDRIGNKHIRPTRLPESPEDMEVEWAVATVAIREAVREHLSVMRGDPLSHGEDELLIENLVRRRRESRAREESLALDGYDLVIGSGGVLSHSPREAAARMLTAALDPMGPIELAVDRAFILPHLGVLSEVDAALAKEIFDSLALVPLGTLVAADGPATGALRVRGTTSGGESIDATVAGGDLAFLPVTPGETVDLRVRPAGMKLRSTRVRATGGALGLIVDARGRPPAVRRMSFASSPVEPPPPRTGQGKPAAPEEHTTIRISRELAIPGEVLVRPGEVVREDTVVARCTRAFLRPFFLRAAKAVHVPPEELPDALEKEIGDEVAAGEVLVRQGGGFFFRKEYRSPVAGRIERILPDGTVVLRESPEHATGLVAVQASKELALPPRRLEPHLRVEIGQEVERGQALARICTSGGYRSCFSPVRGRVSRIDLEFGILLIEPILEELTVRAWLPGTVMETNDRGAIVASPGSIVTGEWGYGGEASGSLSVDRMDAGAVVAVESPAEGLLERAAERKVAGLITGGLPLMEVLEAAPGFPVVLTEGFGVRRMRREVWRLLHAHRGQLALVDGRTELRVGVKRPLVLLPTAGTPGTGQAGTPRRTVG